MRIMEASRHFLLTILTAKCRPTPIRALPVCRNKASQCASVRPLCLDDVLRDIEGIAFDIRE
jgi:hypothetical protein